ncbi:Asparagine--Trna Ligase, Cytoplasmic [Manis pentadactyla]|nr:Asparagine--Trna Ligase, Cytoplasmic [Manis pentadactyla]
MQENPELHFVSQSSKIQKVTNPDFVIPVKSQARDKPNNQLNTYWNKGYSYQQGYGPGYGGSDTSPHGYYGYGPSYYYRWIRGMCSSGWQTDVAVGAHKGAPRGAELGVRLRRSSGRHFLVPLAQAVVLDRRCLGMYNWVGTYGGAGS